MEAKELVRRLEEIKRRQENDRYYSPDQAHEDADDALLEYINDPEVTHAFYGIDKYY